MPSRLWVLIFFSVQFFAYDFAASAESGFAESGVSSIAPPAMRYVPGLAEPLVATGPVTDSESVDLDAALRAFHDAPSTLGAGGDFDDYAQPLLGFIKKHPHSNWNAALDLNLGLGYYTSGYYSRTFGYFEQAWGLGRNAQTIPARRMIDRAVSELADMHARLGHAEQLSKLLADIGDRPVGGSSQRKLDDARNGLRMFKLHPELSYLCGPNALRNLLIEMGASPAQIKQVEDARSGPTGFSLAELAALADQVGVQYTLIYRAPGQPIPVPSIINWRAHHYAALLGTHDGLYELKDPTFGAMASVVTRKAIDEESSGYFLVPKEETATPSDKAVWRTLSASSLEARSVFGMGNVYNGLPGSNTPDDPETPDPSDDPSPPELFYHLDPRPHGGREDQNFRNCRSTCAPRGMTVARAHLTQASLNLTDTPVGYRPQKGPSSYDTVAYNSLEAEQPANFSFSNLSPLWTHSWQAYIQDDPNNPGSSVTRIASGGGGYDYSVLASVGASTYSSATGAFTAETYDDSQLIRIPATGPATSYQRQLPDGSVEVYGLSNGATTSPRYMFLTKVIDPQGNFSTLNYDNQFRLINVTDATGRQTTFTYGLTSAPLLITKITDPFGRFAQFSYDSSLRLQSITDPIGIVSTFTYGDASQPNFVTQLTTPYGTSKFSDILNPNDPNTGTLLENSLAMTDPLGNVELVYVYQNQTVTGTSPSENVVPTGCIGSQCISTDNGLLEWRNTYYWDKHASANGGVSTDANGNPIAETWANATIYHWFHQCCSINYLSNQIGSIKKPLEAYREWTNYPNQSQNYYTGSLIRPTLTGRVLDDGTTQLSGATYNGLGNPLSSTDGAGRTTQYSYAANNIDLLTVTQMGGPTTYLPIANFSNYNSQHEPQTYVGADGETWRYTYNPAGQLASVTDPLTETTTYNYDSLGRLASVTNANDATAVALTYDSADRVNTLTDSEGYVLTIAYDNLDRVTSVLYPDGTTDLYNYNFQSGANRGKPSLELRTHTDRLGRVTTYAYDADRRLTSVTQPVSAEVTRTTSYDYYENWALKDLIDPNGNKTHWTVDLQSRPTAKTYAYGTSKAVTETYAYETNTSRLASITDALGQVTAYSYAHDDRVIGLTYTGAVNPTPNVLFAWDPHFPRLTQMTDGLGVTNYSYFPVGMDGALQLYEADGPFDNDVISPAYDPLGRLSKLDIPGGNEEFGYDSLSRLNSHTTPLGTFSIGYLGQTNQMTNRSVTNGKTTVSTSWGYDTNSNDRRLISIINSGITRSYSLGYVSDGATNPYDILSVSDNAAAGHPFASQAHAYGYDLIDRLLSATATDPGNDAFEYDKADNATTVTTPAGTTNPTYNSLNEIATWGTLKYKYDANGNLLSGDGIKTYKWDAANRLVEIDFVGSKQKSQFEYDGLGHRTVDLETSTKGVTTTTRYLWCGDRICQTRDSSDDVLKRDLNEGEYTLANGTQIVYMPDQLGSVRDSLSAASGKLVDAFDYAPYGGVDRSSGTAALDYQYAQLFHQSASGLDFGTYRVLDPSTGRFINRDPIGESGGPNLYSYTEANPLNNIDPQGTVTIKPDLDGTVRHRVIKPGAPNASAAASHALQTFGVRKATADMKGRRCAAEAIRWADEAAPEGLATGVGSALATNPSFHQWAHDPGEDVNQFIADWNVRPFIDAFP